MNKFKLFLVCLLLFSANCEDDDLDLLSDCGCNSESIDTVPSENFPEVPIEEQTSGLLFYKSPENIDFIFDGRNDGKYNNQFWIFRGVEGCGNCRHHFIVCNEDFLEAKFDYLKNVNDSIPVSFSGELKFLCVDPFPVPADYSYSEIKLTTIE